MGTGEKKYGIRENGQERKCGNMENMEKNYGKDNMGKERKCSNLENG